MFIPAYILQAKGSAMIDKAYAYKSRLAIIHVKAVCSSHILGCQQDVGVEPREHFHVRLPNHTTAITFVAKFFGTHRDNTKTTRQ